MLLVDFCILVVVGILVSFAISDLLHELGSSIANVKRYRKIPILDHISFGLLSNNITAVVFGSFS